jgi:hypothetical protein
LLTRSASFLKLDLLAFAKFFVCLYWTANAARPLMTSNPVNKNERAGRLAPYASDRHGPPRSSSVVTKRFLSYMTTSMSLSWETAEFFDLALSRAPLTKGCV